MSARVRTGKIARLPREIREELNRRLRDGELGKTLVAWLNSQSKVQAMLKAHFGGRGVTTGNLSEWTQGGYREWLVQQEAVEVVQRMEADAGELAEVSHTPVIDLLSQRLAARYVVAAQALNLADGRIDMKLLRELCNDVVALRRSDQRAERLKIERDRLRFEREQLHKMREEELLQWAWKRREAVLSHIEARAKERARFYGAVLADDQNARRSNGRDQLPDSPAPRSVPAKPDPARLREGSGG